MSRKPGREVECPCGSGLRYKDCCMRRGRDGAPGAPGSGRAGARPARAATDGGWGAPALDSPGAPAPDPPVRDPSSTDFAGLGPAQARQMLRHMRLPMMRVTMDLRGGDDPVRVGGDPEGTSRLTSMLRAMDAGGWDIGMVRRMPTEGILEHMGEIGVGLDEARFRDLASEHWSAIALADEELLPQVPGVGVDDEDFVWMAAHVLWDRLLPGWPSVEQLDDAMQEGYNLLARGDLAAAVARWWDAWSLVKCLVDPSVTDVLEADGTLPVRITQSLFNWCQDHRTELHNAALEDAARLRDLARFSREFVTRFPDTDDAIVFDMRAAEAEAHARMGDAGRSGELFRALAEDRPGDPWALIHWGDSYWMHAHQGGRAPSPGDLARAEELYRRALSMADAVRGPVEGRLRDLERARGGRPA